MIRKGAHNKLGSTGESLAAEFLIRKGYVVLDRNLVLRVGEVDLLCQDQETIVIVEVKTARSLGVIHPVFKINYRKQIKLHSLGQIIAAKFPGRNIRFDAITIYFEHTYPHIEHWENIL